MLGFWHKKSKPFCRWSLIVAGFPTIGLAKFEQLLPHVLHRCSVYSTLLSFNLVVSSCVHVHVLRSRQQVATACLIIGI